MPVTDDFRVTEIHVSPKGSEFVIKKNGPLFEIHMKNGGVRPDFTLTKYTSYKGAMAAMDRYFKNNPKPEPRPKANKTEE
jgi:hypothetical protein